MRTFICLLKRKTANISDMFQKYLYQTEAFTWLLVLKQKEKGNKTLTMWFNPIPHTIKNHSKNHPISWLCTHLAFWKIQQQMVVTAPMLTCTVTHLSTRKVPFKMGLGSSCTLTWVSSSYIHSVAESRSLLNNPSSERLSLTIPNNMLSPCSPPHMLFFFTELSSPDTQLCTA